MASLTPCPFTRVRFSWLAYALLAFYSFAQATLGPLLVFLRSELNLSYSTASLHVSAFAAGMLVSGSLGDRLAQRWGRRATFWGGAGGMAVGALGLALGGHLAITLGGTLCMGLWGSLLLMMIQAGLSDQHGDQR